MRHVLFTPSSKDKYPKLPLIILLHGSGEVAKDKQRFLWSSFYYIMNNWNTEGFNAYVVYPQLYGNFYDNVWCSKTSKNNLKNLIEHLIATEKIDPQRIVIAGSSLGAQGAQYMAHEMPGSLIPWILQYFISSTVFANASFINEDHPVG